MEHGKEISMTSRRWLLTAWLLCLAGLSLGAASAATPHLWMAVLPLISSPPPVTPSSIPHFVVSDLGTLGGIRSSANGINDLSQAVGSSLTSSGAEHAFLYSAGKMTDLGTLGGTSSVALGINNLGHVVGNSETARQAAQLAFLYDGSRMIDLGTLGGLNSSASGINDADDVVGYSFMPVVSHSFVTGIVWLHAFLYTGGKMSDLGTLGGPNSTGAAINAVDQIAGNSFIAVNSAQHGFLYSSGKMSDLGTLGGTNSMGIGVNALGETVGSSFLSGDNAFHAFVVSSDKMIDVGALGGSNSSANSINASGQVVGESDTASGVEHAFFWNSGAMTDLNSLIPAISGWELSQASAISDGGEIVGSGNHNGQTRGFLLTPDDGKALTPAEVAAAKVAIDDLINQLGTPSNSPSPTLLRLNYLTSKLHAARLKLDQGNRMVVVNLLQSFINVASRLTDQELAPSKKQLLVDVAQAIVGQLGY
jgi:probable HAF family extracellular repeat protein